MGYGYLVRLDVFTAGRGKKVCTIYDSNGEQLGAAHNIERIREMAGWKQISFDIPIQYNGEMNWRVQYMTPEYEIRVTDGSEVDWFRITEPTESDTGTKSELHVVCPHISTILKKRNIYMAFDDTNGIGTLAELVGRALEGTGWGIGTADTIYETDGVTEKIRTYNCDEKTGAFAMVQEICQKFGAYPEFNGDQQLVDLRDRKKHRRMLEMGIDKNLMKISRTRNTDDIITRLYVEGEYGDDGYVGIDDVNPTHLSFLLNFEYYRSIGALTPAQDQAQQTYMSEMLRLKLAIMEKAAALESNQTALELNWGNQGYVIWSVINGAYSPTVVYGGGATTADNITIGDTVAFVGGGGDYEYGTFSSLTPPSEKFWAVKFLRPCGGALGGKEIAVEAKNETLQTLNEKLDQYTADQVQERESLITQIQQTTAEIAVIRNGTETDVGQWALMLSCINLTGQIVQNESQLVALQNEQKTTETTFSNAMGSLLQDGYFNDSTYGVGQEEALYNDSYEILNALSKPQLSYELSEIDLANTPGYTDEIYYMNSSVHFYNPRIDVNDYGFVTQITEDLDIANTRRVKIETDELNIQGKTFGTMMGRIVNAAQNLVDNKSIYARAAAIGVDGTLGAEKLDGIIDVLQNRLESTQSNWYTDDNGNIIFESADGTNAMMLCGSGFMVANGKTDAGRWNWRTFGTGEGFTADLITAGILRAGLITILGSEQFYWNDQNIYVINPEDTDQQIRIGKYDGEHLGIGYTNDGGETWFSAISFDGVHLSASDEIKLNAGVGGTNLVQIADGLVKVGTGSIERDLSDEYYRHSLTEYIMSPFSSGYNYVTFDEQSGYEIQIAPGDYTLSFWCKADTANDGRVIMPDLYSATTQLPFESITPTTEWKHYKLTLHNESTIDSVALRLMSFTPWATGNVYFSDVKLETGIKDTAWSPNPEEFQAGSVLRMNKDGTYIATPEFEVDINGSTEFMRIDENGMVTDHLTAQDNVKAPNVAEKYVGSFVVKLGAGAADKQVTITPENFELWYVDHVLQGDGSGGAIVNPNSNWDMYRYGFSERTQIRIEDIDQSSLSGILVLAYELNSTYYPLFTTDVGNIYDVDALLINCAKQTSIVGDTPVQLTTSNFTPWYLGAVFMANEGGAPTVVNNEKWDIYRYSLNGRKTIRLDSLTPDSRVQGVYPIFYELDSTYYPLTSTGVPFEADALLVNTVMLEVPKEDGWTSFNLSYSDFSTVALNNAALMQNGDSVFVTYADGWSIKQWNFSRRQVFKLTGVSASLTGVVVIAYVKDNTYYPIDLEDYTKEYEGDALVINSYKQTVWTGNTAQSIIPNTTYWNLIKTNKAFMNNGGAPVFADRENWDVYEFPLTSGQRIRLDNIVVNNNIDSVYPAGFKQDGNYYPLSLSEKGQIFQADSIIVNCLRTTTTTDDTWTDLSIGSSFTTEVYAGGALMQNGDQVYVQMAPDWSILRHDLGGRRRIKIKSYTANSNTDGTAVVALERDNTYYPINLEDLTTEYEADALVINRRKMTASSWNSYTYTNTAFSLYQSDIAMMNDGSGGVYFQPAANWCVYRKTFETRTRIKCTEIVESSSLSGVTVAAYEVDGNLFTLLASSTTEIECDAILINCHLGGFPVTLTPPDGFVLYDSNKNRFMDITAAGVSQYNTTSEASPNWDVYTYELGDWQDIRIDGVIYNPQVTGVYAIGAWVGSLQVVRQEDIEAKRVYNVNTIKINVIKQNTQYAATEITYTPNPSTLYFSATSIDVDVYDTSESYAYSATSLVISRYNNDGMIVINRAWSYTDMTITPNMREMELTRYSALAVTGNQTIPVTQRRYSTIMSMYTPNVRYETQRTYSLDSATYTPDPNAPLNSFETLAELGNAINNKVITQDLIVNMAKSVYGDIWLGGLTGVGSLTINGNGYTLVSNMSFYNEAVPIVFNDTIFNGSIGLNSCKYVTFNNCILNGSDVVALFLGGGTVASLNNCKLFNSNTLINAQSGSTLITQNLTGGISSKNFLIGAFSHIMMAGTRPEGTISLTACLVTPEDPSKLPPVSDGSVPSPSAPTATQTFAAIETRTYHQTSWTLNDTALRQGVMNMTSGSRKQSGCIWFNLSALTGTVQNASLTLTRKAGFGISGNVEVSLYGTKGTYPNSDPTSSGNKIDLFNGGSAQIGTIGNGETKTFTIPATAVTQMKDGTINGLMLQASDTAVINGKGYSRNYANFYGVESAAYLPILTVVTS